MHDHHHHRRPSVSDERYRDTRKVTLIGSAIDLVLGVGKITTGYMAYSQALIADGIHSLSDLGTDMVVLVAAKHANREADENHPYGHGRIETLSTVVLGVALIFVAVGIGIDAINKLLVKEYLMPTMPALVVAFISIIAKEAIYHYTMFYAKKLRSKMLEANAWHSRSDSISSVVVVIAILGTMAGVEYLDAIAAIVVSIIIVRIGWHFAWSSIRELVDTGLEPEEISKINAIINKVSGVEDTHFLRTRSMGSEALVDVHIQVDSELSVSEGHQISETVRYHLIKNVEEISDVMVHIDPEDDKEDMSTCCELPLRNKLLAELEQQWQTISASNAISKVTLHYLEGKIVVELFLPLNISADFEGLALVSKQLKESVLTHPDVGAVRVNFTT